VLTHCYRPGNVRELENCIERTATMVRGETITDTAFPCQHQRCLTQTLHHLDKDDAVAAVGSSSPSPSARHPVIPIQPAAADSRAPDAAHAGPAGPLRIGPGERIAEAMPERRYAEGSAAPSGERERLIWALEQCGWVQAKAARLLKITPRQMGYALQRHQIEVQKL
jgi:Nif-specific regulatory protein